MFVFPVMFSISYYYLSSSNHDFLFPYSVPTVALIVLGTILAISVQISIVNHSSDRLKVVASVATLRTLRSTFSFCHPPHWVLTWLAKSFRQSLGLVSQKPPSISTFLFHYHQ
jgi:hypothetical protein